jgi:hypothetical protein
MLPRLAARDLAGRREWATSLAMLSTIVVVTAVCLASYCLVRGRWQVERRRVDREAWALVLRVGNSLTTRGTMNESVLATLREKLATRFADAPQAIRAIHPYRSCVDRIQLFSRGSTRASLRGRTVYFDANGPDLYLSGHSVDPPESLFQDADDEGILLTPQALEKLGLPPDTSPSFTLTAEVVVDAMPVKVVGVFRENLPDHYDFVLTEGYERKLMLGDPDYEYILTGELPAAWQSGDGAVDWQAPDGWLRLPQAITSLLDSVELLDGRLRLQAKSYFDGATNSVRSSLSRSQWRQLLDDIATEMARRTGVASQSFTRLDTDAQVDDSLTTAYDMVNVYVRDASALGPAADICDEVVNIDGQGTVNRDVIRRLESIDARLRDSMDTIHVQQTVIVLLSAFTLSVLQIFRAIGKTSEVGMLRAMGMKRRQVISFIACQAFLLAAIGACLGMLLGGAAALGLSASHSDTLEDALLGVGLTWQLPVLIGSGALIVTLASGFLASSRWFVQEPARLMR